MIYFCIFLTGASVMVIELLGTRVIAPFYGASLYVWSALISVTMMALALGYFLGGRLADRSKGSLLERVIALSASAVLLIPLISHPVLLWTDPFGLRLGSFISAFILFTPALFLLGMVAPIAIKEATRSLSGVGASSGQIYAVSTLGSVAGTMVLAYALYPLVGSRHILMGLGALLLLLSGLFMWRTRSLGGRVTRFSGGLLLLLGGVLLAINLIKDHQAPEGPYQVVSERESLYGRVRVIDHRTSDLRLLSSDASVIGAASLATGQNRLTYQQIVSLIPLLKPGFKKALLIGQGAGHMAMDLQERYGIETDTIEIDPEVARAASDYFGFKPTGNAFVGDGRYVIRGLQGPYDLIIHDCFTGGSEPTHLLTVEALQDLRRLLSPTGVLALNFVSFASPERNQALASVRRTAEAVFEHTRIFRSEPEKDFNDFIVLASHQPVTLDSKHLTHEMITWLEDRETPIDAARGVLVTDDFNPMEHLQISKAERYRATVVDWLGAELLIP